MRRIAVVLGLCALLLPIAAWADGIDLTNKYGTVSVTSAGVVSKGLQLMSYKGIVAPPHRSLGSVDFSTGSLSSGDIWTGGTFSSAGSSFVVTSSGGGYGQPPKGIVFVGPITWTLVSQTGKYNYNFMLSGTIYGVLYTGRSVTGTTTQYITLDKNQWNHGHRGWVSLGKTNLAIPEPGTLGLLGTGLIAVAGTMRRKLLGA